MNGNSAAFHGDASFGAEESSVVRNLPEDIEGRGADGIKTLILNPDPDFSDGKRAFSGVLRIDDKCLYEQNQ
jgi:hypothetical protein